MKLTLAVLTAWLAPLAALPAVESAIDRHALVMRHTVVLTNLNEQLPLQVGNGEFAFGVDVTGLQTLYGNTMSHWGWHSVPLPAGKKPEDFRFTEFDTYGRKVGYATDSKGQEQLFAWLRENPHRLNLGKISLRVDGKPVVAKDLKEMRQELDLWRGVITSHYTLAGEPVEVTTCCHPTRDIIAVRFSRPLGIAVAFPYGDKQSSGADWKKPAAHQTTLALAGNRANFVRRLDLDNYAVSLAWGGPGTLTEEQPHTFALTPVQEFVCAFGIKPDRGALPTFAEVQAASEAHWKKFWSTGGAIDLSASKDPRWHELERRIVLSQYLLAVNEAGSLPPEESGLFNNSGWNGKFHLEMHWWHGVHFALWDRWPLFERSLGWYAQIFPVAREIAARQGYRGVRWPKMVGPDGHDSPSGTGPLLIWQQPHPIYYANLDYRLHPTRETLEKWRAIVFSTAEFMASYAVYDPAAGSYVLGPPMKTVPENTSEKARNPAFELSYWRFGLRVAQQWRELLGLPREPEWDKVLKGLAPLPEKDGVYLQQEGMIDTFTKMNWEHPSLIGPLGMLPGDGVDPAQMKATVKRVLPEWQWDRCWGWDFPMMAMAAARNGEPALAIEALLHSSKKNGFNIAGLSTGGPYPYFPSNGGLLTAVAMMAAGWDGGPNTPAPGFPADGSWQVKWEGLKKMP